MEHGIVAGTMPMQVLPPRSSRVTAWSCSLFRKGRGCCREMIMGDRNGRSGRQNSASSRVPSSLTSLSEIDEAGCLEGSSSPISGS